uniref:Uncharacterized protein n=1 Tax=Romanomermis culicivorax TaxID=13658 RepID=A0A915JRW0_ROMCU
MILRPSDVITEIILLANDSIPDVMACLAPELITDIQHGSECCRNLLNDVLYNLTVWCKAQRSGRAIMRCVKVCGEPRSNEKNYTYTYRVMFITGHLNYE